MKERAKPIWVWIVTVIVALPVMYVLSFGPACWITAKPYNFSGPSPTPSYGMIVYWPLGRITLYGTTPLTKASPLTVIVEWWMTCKLPLDKFAVVYGASDGKTIIGKSASGAGFSQSWTGDCPGEFKY